MSGCTQPKSVVTTSCIDPTKVHGLFFCDLTQEATAAEIQTLDFFEALLKSGDAKFVEVDAITKNNAGVISEEKGGITKYIGQGEMRNTFDLKIGMDDQANLVDYSYYSNKGMYVFNKSGVVQAMQDTDSTTGVVSYSPIPLASVFAQIFTLNDGAAVPFAALMVNYDGDLVSEMVQVKTAFSPRLLVQKRVATCDDLVLTGGETSIGVEVSNESGFGMWDNTIPVTVTDPTEIAKRVSVTVGGAEVTVSSFSYSSSSATATIPALSTSDVVVLSLFSYGLEPTNEYYDLTKTSIVQ